MIDHISPPPQKMADRPSAIAEFSNSHKLVSKSILHGTHTRVLPVVQGHDNSSMMARIHPWHQTAKGKIFQTYPNNLR